MCISKELTCSWRDLVGFCLFVYYVWIFVCLLEMEFCYATQAVPNPWAQGILLFSLWSNVDHRRSTFIQPGSFTCCSSLLGGHGHAGFLLLLWLCLGHYIIQVTGRFPLGCYTHKCQIFILFL